MVKDLLLLQASMQLNSFALSQGLRGVSCNGLVAVNLLFLLRIALE